MMEQARVTRQHRARVLAELRLAGASWWAQWHTATSRVAELVHPEEHVNGVVYGYRNTSFTMIVATDRRILIIAHTLVFSNEEELTYDVVSGVSVEDNMFSLDFTLHTRVKDYRIRVYNRDASFRFRAYLEQRCLEHAPPPLAVKSVQNEEVHIPPKPLTKRT